MMLLKSFLKHAHDDVLDVYERVLSTLGNTDISIKEKINKRIWLIINQAELNWPASICAVVTLCDIDQADNPAVSDFRRGF